MYHERKRTFIAAMREVVVDGDELVEIELHSERGPTSTISVGTLLMDDADASMFVAMMRHGAEHCYGIRFRTEQPVLA